MDILGIGFSELIFIFIIAMLVFGPRRLPEIAGKAGKIVRDLRSMSNGLLNEWQREITVAANLEELEKTRQELNKAKEDIKQARKQVTEDTSEAVKKIVPPSLPDLVAPQPPANTPNPKIEQPEVAPPKDSTPESATAKTVSRQTDTSAVASKPVVETSANASTVEKTNSLSSKASPSGNNSTPSSTNKAPSVPSTNSEKAVNEQ